MSVQTTRRLVKICVFCGSSMGKNNHYRDAAKAMGLELVKRGIGLVYGGGSVGLMGVISATVVDGLGADKVLGVLPESMGAVEVASKLLGKTIMVPDMHTRKATMAENADGFITMPGGLGTLEELLEVVTWQQLGYHDKPIALYNVGGFFDPLLEYIKRLVEEGFVREAHANNLIVSADPAEIIDKMTNFEAAVSLLELAKTGQAKLESAVPLDD